MNKTLSINLAGFMFHIDEDAYQQLENYLAKIKAQFAHTEGGNEIIQDIEGRIAELFRSRTGESKEVINKQDVAEIIGIMGQPEDYLEADDTAYEEKQQQTQWEDPYSYQRSSRTIFRDGDNRIIGGVAAGLSHYFKMDPIWMRLLFVALFFAGFGTFLYIILWIVVPKARTTAEKLQMRGEKVNISNIEKSIREEMDALGGKMRGFADKASKHDYNQYSRKTSSFFADLGSFIGMAVRTIIKVIGKILGFALIVFSFIVLVGIIAALLTGGFHALGNDVGFWSLLDFLELVTVDEFHYTSLLVGLFLITVGPLFLFIYFGMRLLLNVAPINSSARNGVFISIAAGIVILIITGSRIGFNFNSDAVYSERYTLQNQSDSIYIYVNEDSVYQAYSNQRFHPSWLHLGDKHIFRDVEFNIFPTDDSLNFLITEVNASGPSHREARSYAKDLDYRFDELGEKVYFDNYYVLDSNSRFRAQEVKHRLYIHKGTRVFLGENTIDFIYDIRNTDNLWDYDMVNHWWEMTDKGLECLDCVEQYDNRWPGDEEEEIETPIETEEENDTTTPYEVKVAQHNMEVHINPERFGPVAQLILFKSVEMIL